MKEIKKNSQEIIRVESKEYKGNKFLDCRVYFLDKVTQEYRPTKKGISLLFIFVLKLIPYWLDREKPTPLSPRGG